MFGFDDWVNEEEDFFFQTRKVMSRLNALIGARVLDDENKKAIAKM